LEQPYEVHPGLHVLPAIVPVPNIGQLPVNSYLVMGAQPYLVDTGLPVDADRFVRAVGAIVDLDDLQWIYLTHTDPDHIGALVPLLEQAPRATVVTTFLAVAKLELGLRHLPPNRLLLRNPGERLDLGDRALSIMTPPLFDAPETTSVHDSRLDALFSADAFGGPLGERVALSNEIPASELESAQLLWSGVDAPWVHDVDRERYAARFAELVDLEPDWILSSHLPPARGMTPILCRNLAGAPDAPPFVGPDQEAFEAVMRESARH
jgi:flavorubredoxin